MPVFETKDNGTEKMYYIHKDYLGSFETVTDEFGQVVEKLSFDPCSVKPGFRKRCAPETLVELIPTALAHREGCRRRNPTNWTYNNIPETYRFDRGFTGHEHLDNFDLINMNGRVYDPWLGRFLSPDNYVQSATYSQNFNRYSYALNNPLKYTDPSGEIIWVPIVIGAVIGTYMGGTLANNDYNPANWDYSSGKTWGYMAGGAIVGGISGYFGGMIAATEIPMSNTLGIMGASLVNSVGTSIYTGGQTDISISFGVGSFNFNTGKFNGIWNWNNISTMEKIGYSLGAILNSIDLYRFATWDVLSFEEKLAKLQKQYPNNNISYDPSTTKEGFYNENNKTIYLGKRGLNKNYGWAKSTVEHEYQHYLDYKNQDFDLTGIEDQRSYNILLDERAYLTEMNNAAKNGLSYTQYQDIINRLTHNATLLNHQINMQSYSLKLWILSIIKR